MLMNVSLMKGFNDDVLKPASFSVDHNQNIFKQIWAVFQFMMYWIQYIILLVFFLTLCYFLIIRSSATNIKGGRPADYKTHRCFGEDEQLYQVIGSTCMPITFGGNDSYIFVLNDEGINKLTS